jgi:hypothetical protein
MYHDVFSATNSSDQWKKWAGQDNLPRIYWTIAQLVEKTIVRMPADIILTGSNGPRKDLIKFNASPHILVIPYGSDLGDYDKSGSKKGL